MSDLLDAIKARRAVRKYTDQMVEREKIDKVIEAGLYAANGKGRQEPHIIAVTNRDLRDRLSTLNREIGGWDPPFDPFYGAPVILLVVVDEDYKNRVYDGSLVMGNMMLEASSLGLGSCWVHRARETMKSRLGQEILKAAGLTDKTYEGIAFCILGYPDEKPQAAARREGRVHFVE